MQRGRSEYSLEKCLCHFARGLVRIEFSYANNFDILIFSRISFIRSDLFGSDSFRFPEGVDSSDNSSEKSIGFPVSVGLTYFESGFNEVSRNALYWHFGHICLLNSDILVNLIGDFPKRMQNVSTRSVPC